MLLLSLYRYARKLRRFCIFFLIFAGALALPVTLASPHTKVLSCILLLLLLLWRTWKIKFSPSKPYPINNERLCIDYSSAHRQ